MPGDNITAMIEEKAPLCDTHHRKMLRHVYTLFGTNVFKCPATNCGRYYARRYGYFNLIPVESAVAGEMDPANRLMKACSTKQHDHSYMAMTRPKSDAPGTKALWRWHCYACSTVK
jgi:hypothetical protein